MALRKHGYAKDFAEYEGKSLIVTGPNGTSKTGRAIATIMKVIEQGRTATYLKFSEIMRIGSPSVKFGKDGFDEKIQKEKLVKICLEADFLVIDELDKIFTEVEKKAFDEIFDDRYSSGKQTIVISNHRMYEEDTGPYYQSLREILSPRVYSRLQSFELVVCGGRDRRVCDITKFDFSFCGTILASNSPHIMTFLARNPVFKNISKQERSRLEAEDDAGNMIDLSRPKDDIYQDTWEKGDHLIVRGPVCCSLDAITYLGLIMVLTERHKHGFKGLRMQTNATEVYRILGKEKIGGTQRRFFQRSVERLSSMNLRYRNAAKKRWFAGPLCVSSGVTDHIGQVDVEFNSDVMELYAGGQFQILSKEVLKVSGSDLILSMFLQTQETKKVVIYEDKLLDIIGISNLSNKDCRVRIDSVKKSLKPKRKESKNEKIVLSRLEYDKDTKKYLISLKGGYSK